MIVRMSSYIRLISVDSRRNPQPGLYLIIAM